MQLEKLTTYLLNLEHSRGRSKAKFFIDHGFRSDQPKVLQAALAQHPATNTVSTVKPSAWGDRFAIRCNLATPDGRNPCILTVWISEAGRPPRLLTAYPEKGRQ